MCDVVGEVVPSGRPNIRRLLDRKLPPEARAHILVPIVYRTRGLGWEVLFRDLLHPVVDLDLDDWVLLFGFKGVFESEVDNRPAKLSPIPRYSLKSRTPLIKSEVQITFCLSLPSGGYPSFKTRRHQYSSCNLHLDVEGIPPVRNQRRRELKARAVQHKGGKCVICKYVGPPEAYDFHHVDAREKDFNISSRSAWTEAFQRELDRTELLCCRCHREVHAGYHPKYFVSFGWLGHEDSGGWYSDDLLGDEGPLTVLKYEDNL